MHPFERLCSYRVAYCLALGVAFLPLAGCVTDETATRETGANRDVAAAPAAEHVARPAAPGRHAASSSQAGVRYSAVGLASWYGADFHGRRTADGETFDMHSLTAAHRTLPMQCMVRVTNLANNRSLLVRVNDRGPYTGDRLIDLSAQSAKLLGFYDRGLAKVKVDYIAPARRAAPPLPRVTAQLSPPL